MRTTYRNQDTLENFKDSSLLMQLDDSTLNDVAQDALSVVKCRDA